MKVVGQVGALILGQVVAAQLLLVPGDIASQRLRDATPRAFVTSAWCDPLE